MLGICGLAAPAKKCQIEAEAWAHEHVHDGCPFLHRPVDLGVSNHLVTVVVNLSIRMILGRVVEDCNINSDLIEEKESLGRRKRNPYF